MASNTIDLFINPTAGRGRARQRLEPIRALFAASGFELVVHSSRAVGDMEACVHRFVAQGGKRLVVVGGDGSVHESVNGIMRAGADAAMGVVPSGTGNDFAKACSIPLDWQRATVELAERLSDNTSSRYVDVGVMNERYFANGAGIGFDAKVTQIARSYRWQIGDFVYLLAIFSAMRDGIATPEFRITGDGVERCGPVTLASIANGAWIGGMFHIAPPASNSDGILDVVVAEPVTRTRILGLLPKLMRGRHIAENEVSHKRVRQLRIESLEPVPSHLDGEMQPMQTEFQIRVLPGALRLL